MRWIFIHTIYIFIYSYLCIHMSIVQTNRYVHLYDFVVYDRESVAKF